MKIVVRLVSWLSAHLTSQNHNSASLHPVLEIKLKCQTVKLGFYLSNGKLTYIFSKLNYSCLKLFLFLWDTLYTNDMFFSSISVSKSRMLKVVSRSQVNIRRGISANKLWFDVDAEDNTSANFCGVHDAAKQSKYAINNVKISKASVFQ